MASADGKWKVVKKSKKPGDRRALGESNLTGVPIKTTNTLYEMGFQKKQNKEQVPPGNGTTAEPPAQKKQHGKNAKKAQNSDANPAQRKFHTVEEALKALDVSTLQHELVKSQNMFPDNPTIWLKDLAGYLNDKLQTARMDPTLSQQSHDYPYCLVNKELRNLIRSLVGKAGTVLGSFVDYCILLMLQELDRPTGESLHGYRICIQAVLLDKPKTVTANLKKYLDLLWEHEKKPVKCLVVMWAVGQAGFADLTEGLKVWLGIMLPVLGKNPLSPYAISYLDRLLLMHSNLTKGFGMIGPKDFFPLLDFTFMPKNSLSHSQQTQLRDLYPRLKVLAFGATPENTLHTYFPSFLSRATPNCPTDMKKELMLSLSECLKVDPLSFNVWRQLYTKHLSQSSLLLQHLLETWTTTSKSMQKSLKETVQSFQVTNKECSAKGQNVRDIETCEGTCQKLLQRLKGGRIPWFRFFLVAVTFLVGFLMFDVRTHGSFEASSSGKLLRQSELLHLSRAAWGKASHLLENSWLEANVPLYYSQAADVMGPHLELLWVKSKEGAVFVSEKCSTIVNLTVDNLPFFIEWLQAKIPDSVYHLLEYIREVLLYLHRAYLLPAVQYSEATAQRTWQQYVNSCNGEPSWDCMKGHMTNVTQSSWTYVQNATLAIRNWASAMLFGH
ncbi:transmembrane protein 214 isoform 2-T2 [Pelodytes ibericus]